MGQLLEIKNQGRFRDYKTGQKDYKVGQRLKNGGKRLQIGAGITNRCRTVRAIKTYSERSWQIRIRVIHTNIEMS